jgi:serine phosphatase RsbU (regulator of sigma subunit)
LQSESSLKRFYKWVKLQGLITESPFDSHDFKRPFLNPRQVRKRTERLPSDTREREVYRLRALNRLGDHLNRSADVSTLLDGALEIVVEVMGLKSAWAYIWTKSGIHASLVRNDAPHDFVLAGCCGLPAGLDEGDRHHLREPPDCTCQMLLRSGRLVRGANVVICQRALGAAQDNHDTGNLQFHATVPLISQGRRLGMINVATEEWEFLTAADLQLLSAAASQIAIALERARLYDVAERQRSRFEWELDMARRVQTSLIPRDMPEVAGFTIAADWRAAREVAGDFYDIFSLPEGRWGVVVGDVSDKGAPAALYMAMARSLIRTEAERCAGPSTTLTEVNRRLQSESSTDLFVTVFYGVLDPEKRILTYSLAGHNPPLVRRSSGEVESLPYGGLILGVFEEPALIDKELTFQSGDSLFVYTDGVTDAEDSQGECFDLERLEAAIREALPTAPDLLERVLGAVADFAGDAPQPDDMTALALSCD